MKNKAIIIASVCLLAAGGSAVYISTRPSASAAAKNSVSGSVSSASNIPATAISPEIVANSSSLRPRPVIEYPELDKKFGASQVLLAKHATDSWLKFGEDMNKLREIMVSDVANAGEEDKDKKDHPLSSVPGLTLTAEQNAKINAAYVKWKATEDDAARMLLARFTKNRTDFMELLLAGDAWIKGKMSLAEYKAVVVGKDELIREVSVFKLEHNTIQHPFYRSELSSILDQDQLAVFEKFRDEQAGETDSDASVVQQIIGIKKTPDGFHVDARTLELFTSSLKKANMFTDSALKITEVMDETSNLGVEDGK